jgi:hypothetical protein
LDLTDWKITLPIGKDGKKEGQPMEVEQPLLKSYFNKQYFYVNQDKTGVVFRADVAGEYLFQNNDPNVIVFIT